MVDLPEQNIVHSLKFSAELALAMIAGMQLDLFTPLQKGPLAAADLAEELGVDTERLERLLFALVLAGLLTEENGHFGNTPDAHRYLVKGSKDYQGHLHGVFTNHLRTNMKSADSVRLGSPQAAVDFSNASVEELEAFLTKISPSSASTARILLERFDLSSARRLAEIGGGCGLLAQTLAESLPTLHATIIELPRVAQITEKLVNHSEARDRITVKAVDVVNRSVKGQFDVVVLRAFLQVLSPEDAKSAIKNIASATRAGGTIYIIGQILDDSRLAPPEAVAFNLNFLNLYEHGESYTESQHRNWLEDAGFENVQRAGFLIPPGLGVMWAQKHD